MIDPTIAKFAPGSLHPLAVQLGEVKTISEILFAARVNSLDGIQRNRVSDDDTAGPQTDYNNDGHMDVFVLRGAVAQADASSLAGMPPAAGAGRGGLPTVLNEQLLRITLEIEIVKPLPKK